MIATGVIAPFFIPPVALLVAFMSRCLTCSTSSGLLSRRGFISTRKSGDAADRVEHAAVLMGVAFCYFFSYSVFSFQHRAVCAAEHFGRPGHRELLQLRVGHVLASFGVAFETPVVVVVLVLAWRGQTFDTHRNPPLRDCRRVCSGRLCRRRMRCRCSRWPSRCILYEVGLLRARLVDKTPAATAEETGN